MGSVFILLTGLLRSAGRTCLPSTWSLNLRRASSSVGLCPAFPSFPRTRPLNRASKWPAERKLSCWSYRLSPCHSAVIDQGHPTPPSDVKNILQSQIHSGCWVKNVISLFDTIFYLHSLKWWKTHLSASIVLNDDIQHIHVDTLMHFMENYIAKTNFIGSWSVFSVWNKYIKL